ncbi:unnamed protein product [Schistocephalus solidus]|uniref:Transmembrane protein 242 n=1 Tax=Schistocephalus solidus TaxID=70667 RepID=A0A183TPI9_SCHSO|nr:unnamed protein product [Schistocephalus solidus]
MAGMKSMTYTPRADTSKCRLTNKRDSSLSGVMFATHSTESEFSVSTAEARATQTTTTEDYRLVRDEQLVEMTTVQIHGITLLWMSLGVTLFVNIFFGAFALVCSFRAHRLLRSPVRLQQQTPVEPDSWRIPLGHLQAARTLGRVAFAMNAIGILTSMLSLIFAFMYFGTQPEARKSLLSVIQSFLQPSVVNHPALEKGSLT